MVSLSLPLVLETTEVHLTDEQFYQLCRSNPDLTIERSPQGALIVMTPVGGEGGSDEMDLGGELYLWNKQSIQGKVFSSSTLFKLPNGGDRSPDASWVELSRWPALTPEQRRKFPPIAPDFVIELRSPTDDLELLRAKMPEFDWAGWSIPRSNKSRFTVRGNPKKCDSYRLNFLVKTCCPVLSYP